MQSGNGHPLTRRVMRLERHTTPAAATRVAAAWRAELASYFTAPEYANHREAIIDALCSDAPHYRFTLPGDPERGELPTLYVVNWPAHEGVPVVFVLPEPEPAPEE